MREGARGGWVNGSLSWSGLDSWQRQERRVPLRSPGAGPRAVRGPPRARGTGRLLLRYGADKTLDLGGCDSAQLWSLLEEAARLGLKLVHAHPELGEVRRHQRGELLIDVTQAKAIGGRSVSAVLQIDGEDDGRPGAAAVPGFQRARRGVRRARRRRDRRTASRARARRLRLVRLVKPAPAALQRMVLERRAAEIPAGELQRFAEELCPALRNVATVVSSDGSFTPPEISAPTLVLRASYGAEHAVDVGWEWAYQVGARHTARTASPATGPAPGFATSTPSARSSRPPTSPGRVSSASACSTAPGGPPDAHARSHLTGIDSMRLTTEMLPRLAERPDVVVEVVGEPADYRDVGDSLTIGVSTAEIAGERDWFDLGVTISVEGRELPFAEVFTALARGESHMLLDDGAHFSLLDAGACRSCGG